jgi:hypothetical protein
LKETLPLTGEQKCPLLVFPSAASSIQKNQVQQFQKEFQQLGKDLQSGNISAAQADFVTLQQNSPQSNATSSSQSSEPIVQAFHQLLEDLQSGNLSAAQQAYGTLQQDLQNNFLTTTQSTSSESSSDSASVRA